MKTISLKKVAVVAVASLGFGLLSVVPAQAAALGNVTYSTAVTSATACTIAAPCPLGTAITMNLRIANASAMASGDKIQGTYVLKDPNGTTITTGLTFAATAGAIGTNGAATLTGQTIELAATGAVSNATYVVGTLTFTPEMGGMYALTNTNAFVQATGTGVLLDGSTDATTGAFYVSGERVSQGVTRGASGTARLGNQAQVTVNFPSTASTTYKIVSSGVGAISGVTSTGTTTSTISGTSTDFSAGVTTVTAANTNEHSVVATLTNAATAGVQTVTITSVDTATGLASALYSIQVTWSATPALSPAISIVRIAPVGAAAASQGATAAGIGAGFTTTADAIPYSAPRAVGSRVAQIQVILLNSDGTAATQGNTVTASVSGSGFVLTADAATAADGTARSESEALTVGSENVAWINISGDGTAGTGTINITVTDAVSGVTTALPSKTVTFTGSVTKLAVTTTNFTVGKAGSTTGASVAARNLAGEVTNRGALNSSTTTPAFIVSATDSGNRLVTTGVAPTVISSDATVATGGTCTLDNGQDADYSSTVPSAGGANGVGVYNCNFSTAANAASGAKATLTIRVADPASTTGGFLTTTFAVSVGGSIATETVAFDKTSYVAGEAMVITRTAKDSAGNPVADGSAAGAVTFNKPVSGTVGAGFYVGGTSASATSVAKSAVFAPSIPGAFTASMTGGDAAATVRTASSSVTDANAGLLTQIDALNAKIVALNALIAKIMKKLGVK